MASCLGLYIEEDIIKYAKVTKDRDIIKVDAFGIKFYDRLETAINQIIEETYSYKTPISINTPNENYNYFYIFNLLSQKDMNSYINTEFESLCYEKELRADTFESRYILVDDLQDKEKIKAIHISSNKGELLKRTELLNKYKLTSVSPTGINISNLLSISKSENVENIAVVNIENVTTVTSIINQKIYDVNTINYGITEILQKISTKENSLAKAYEICKNSTIYTSDGRELQYEENAYLDDIMPTLYNIVGSVKKILNDSTNKIDKVYITGMASVINNIDIYFQDYLEDVPCEILKPYFIRNFGTDINMKDYIEVNSAIALALQGLGEGFQGINFRKDAISSKLPSWLTMDIGGKGKSSSGGGAFSFSLKGELTRSERSFVKTAVGLFIFTLAYLVISNFLVKQINDKADEASLAQTKIIQQKDAMEADKEKIDEKTAEYTELIQRLQEKSDILTENKRLKYSIPTLLNKIMYSIPVNVQLTSISNSGNRVIITAQSNKYEPIAMFVAKLRNDGILNNVKNNESKKTDEVVVVSIEGDLP